ncbi:ubiquitin-protein ligase E3 [Penicillium malachiteum]|uniref:ubiquitin-protein ligase E3 n=1 Tax=Penicillium malachiteum TaxID=1324776 RepID=UPI0025488D30|nr:ubiquitin-protein ligase E3 [Penicillium malachiteum]KAJ5718897.1 ubiquitin-protein ligase E3 [Penicillium malachiteum]
MADSAYSPELQRLIDTLNVIAPEIATEVVAALDQQFGGIMFELPAHVLQYPMDDENHQPTTFIEWVTNNFDMVDQQVAAEIGHPIHTRSGPNDPIEWRPVVWGLPTGNGHDAPDPICEHCLDLLPRQPADADIIAEHPTCSICTENVELNSSTLTLPCEHIYHENCITIWLRLSSTCPLCRRVIRNL